MSTLGGQELLDLAGEEPARALQETERQLGAPNLDPVDHVWLLRARGVALRCAGRTAESAEELQSAAAIAAELDPDLLAGVETSLAATLMFLGQVPGALEVMDAAIARSKGLPHIEALLQAGAVNLAIGRHNVALEVLSRAIPLAQETGRAKWEADSLNQRGMAFIFDGQSGRALPDLERSVEVASAHGDGLGAAMASCNRALALHRVGRLAESLASFRDVAADYERVGVSAHEIAADWSEALLAAGLFDDAVRITTEAASHFRKTSNVWGSMQCTAIAAEAAFAQGRPDLVKTILHAARATPGSADFTGWLARTELAHVRSQLEADPDALDLEEIDALAATLAAGGQADASLAARIARLRVAGIATSPPRPSGSVDDAGLRSSVARAPTLVQLDYWSTLTALRAHGGDSRGALGAFAAAERRARDVLATTGSYEVRVHASRHLELAADAATGVLLDRRRIRDLVGLIERRRGAALVQSVLRNPSAELSEALARYRDAEARSRAVGDDAGPVIADRAELEHAVQDLARRQQSAPAALAPEVVLADDELVLTFLTHNGHLLRIDQSGGRRSRLVALGPVDSITPIVEDLLFVHRQVARRSGLSGASTAELLRRHRQLTIQLDSALLPDRLAKRVVLNPPPVLQKLPWASLPSLADVEHCVSPMRQLARRPLPGLEPSVILFGSSELPHAEREVRALAQMLGAPGVVDPRAEDLAQRVPVDVLHLAGHFVSAGPNPLFDAIRLGPVDFYGYDFLSRATTPAVVVLSSCASGAVEEVAAAPFGFATAAMGAGASAVIVSHAAVEDSPQLVSCMQDIHRALRDGHGPAAALLAVRRAAIGEAGILASTLSVLGTGWRVSD